jgi:hypothetical protein
MRVRAALSGVFLWGGGLALTMLFAFLLAQRGVPGPVTNPTDFRAFYCAGSAVLARADPYRVEPLRGCEASVLAHAGLHWIPGLVVPAPLPPWDLALFSLFATMPFLVASSLWFALAIVAWFRMVMLLHDLTGLRIVWPALATLGLGLFASLTYGQLMPLSMWLVVEIAAALHAGAERRAALLAIAGTIEPQIGGPVALALFALRPGTRPMLALGAGALLAVSLVTLAPEQCLEWFSQVLPAQANSDLRNAEQFSLTSVLVAAGTAPATARVLGVLDYAVMVVLGIWTAARIDVRWREPAVIALLPAAFAVFGGPYVHQHHLAAALPMALLAFARTRRPEFAAAAVLLSWPWLSQAELIPQLHEAFWRTHAVTLPDVRPDDLAETTWANFIGPYAPQGRAILIATLVKLPLWLGVALVVVPLVRLAAAGDLRRYGEAQRAR